MKIIATGRKAHWFAGRKVKCGKCECIVQLESTDNPNETGSPIYVYFPCPECGSELRIWFGTRPEVENVTGFYGKDVQ